MERDERTEEAIVFLRASLKTYPQHYGLISALVLALRDGGAEAISPSEKVLQNNANEKIRNTVRTNLCFLYLEAGMNKKAQKLGKPRNAAGLGGCRPAGQHF